MNYLEVELLKVVMTSFSLMGQICRGGGELVRGKHTMGRNLQRTFGWFLSGAPKAYEILFPIIHYFPLFLLST